MEMFSAEVVLKGRVITYTNQATDHMAFVKMIKEKVAAKYPKCLEGLQIRQVRWISKSK